MSNYYGSLRAQDEEKKAEHMKKIDENMARVEDFLKKDNKQFLCGNEPGMTDYMVWPHLERITVLMPQVLDKFPGLKAYSEKMEKDKAVIACRHTNEDHKKFINGYRTGNTVYDIGTVTEYSH